MIQALVRSGRTWTQTGWPTRVCLDEVGRLTLGAGEPGEAPGRQFDPAAADVELAGA